jgi:hypothetical protein
MSWGRAIMLVAERELRERLRSKAFLASTALILALVGVSALLVRLADPQETYRVAVPAPAPAGLAAALDRAAQPFDDAQVELRVSPRPRPDVGPSTPRKSTRCCSCPRTGSSSGPRSMRRRRPSPTRPSVRFAASCRLHRS